MYLAAKSCPSINSLFVQSQYYVKKIILGILYICRLVPVLQRGGYFFRMS